MFPDPVLYSDELDEAKLIGLRLLLLERSVMAKGLLDTDCWIWTGALGGPGYGHMRWPDSPDGLEYVHRLSWMAFVGPIKDRLLVLHKCDNGLCIRPEHLYLGTHVDNVRDRDAKRPKFRPNRGLKEFLRRF